MYISNLSFSAKAKTLINTGKSSIYKGFSYVCSVHNCTFLSIFCHKNGVQMLFKLFKSWSEFLIFLLTNENLPCYNNIAHSRRLVFLSQSFCQQGRPRDFSRGRFFFYFVFLSNASLSFSAASARAFSRKAAYMFIVVDIWLCPRTPWTLFGLISFSMAIVAKECRS